MTAISVSAMVGGLADLGYLIFVDFAGYATFFPGTLMTIIAGSAIVLSGWVWLSQREQSWHANASRAWLVAYFFRLIIVV